MFSSGDIVEEISTNRRGILEESGIFGQPPNKWTVKFHDGKHPWIKDFKDANELRLVERPGEGGPPRLIPRDPVV
jgi:hypothetical protein